MTKKGFIFSIDIILAVTTLVVGLIVVYSAYMAEPTYIQSRSVSVSTMNLLMSVPSSTIDSSLIPSGFPVDGTDPLLLTMGALYHTGSSSHEPLRQIMSSFVAGGRVIQVPYAMSLYINGTLIFNTTQEDPASSGVRMTVHRVIVGQYNSTDLWGPYVVQLRVWER